jgi:hypothetical protein
MKTYTAWMILGFAMMVVSALGFAQQGRMGAGSGDQDRQQDRVSRDQQIDRDRTLDRQRAQDRIYDADRDRARDQDRLSEPLYTQDRDRLRDRDIFASNLMTAQERQQYRDRLLGADSDRQWAQIRAQHFEEMQARARQRGVGLPRYYYGEQIMTAGERQQYRDALRAASDEQDRARVRAEHDAMIQARARELGVDLPAPLYGQQLMTAEEQVRFRERLQAATSDRQRNQIFAEHREQMQARAREYGYPVDDLGPSE